MNTSKNGKERGILDGIFPSITTPFIDGKVSEKNLRANIEKYNQIALGGYMILGGNGEYLGLTAQESTVVLKTIMRSKKKDRTIVAGAGRESAEATLEVIEKLAAYGVDVASVITPFYYANRIKEINLAAYYECVADKSPIPIIIYHSPGFAAGVEVSCEIVRRLAKHENIIGMKNSSYRSILEYQKAIGKTCEFAFHSGKPVNFLNDLKCGAAGATLSIAIYTPRLCADIYSSFIEGDIATAEKLNEYLLSLNQLGPSRYGVPGVKAAMDINGFFGGDVRLPLMNLSEKEKKAFIVIFEKYKKAGIL